MSASENDGVFEMAVNGHQLSGVKAGGVWTFTCPTWPDLAAKWSGDTVITNAAAELTRRALAGSITVREIRRALADEETEGGGA